LKRKNATHRAGRQKNELGVARVCPERRNEEICKTPKNHALPGEGLGREACKLKMM